MKVEFDNYLKQGNYINRLIDANTDLKKLCQYCGKPAELKNNKEDPYKIQFVCKDCKMEKGLNTKEARDKMCDDIPLIDVIEHITNDLIKSKIIRITPELKQKVKHILKSSYTKREALDYLGYTNTQFNKFISIYEKEIDKNIGEKLNQCFKSNKAKLIRNVKLKHTINKEANNNLSKLKYEKKITTNDIIRLSNNQITSSAISMICNGKSNPVIKTKCILAEALSVTVEELFPEDWLFYNVKCYQDYLDKNQHLREVLNSHHELSRLSGNVKFMRETAKTSNIPINRLYEFSNGHKQLLHNEMVELIHALSLNMEDKCAAREFRESF